jgi:hypothetical protein
MEPLRVAQDLEAAIDSELALAAYIAAMARPDIICYDSSLCVQIGGHLYFSFCECVATNMFNCSSYHKNCSHGISMLTFNIVFALQSLAVFETYHRPSCRSSIYENTFFQRSQMQNTLATEYVPAIITGTVSAEKMGGPKACHPWCSCAYERTWHFYRNLQFPTQHHNFKCNRKLQER